ncbi:MAG: hypothetical protein R6X12_08790 [bacterium]
MVHRYDGPAGGNDAGRSLVVALNGSIYAAGESWGSGTGADFAVISLDPEVGAAEPGREAGRARHRTSLVADRLHADAAGSLLDISGRAVAGIERGDNELRRLPPGVYVVRTRLGVTGRVVKVR